MASINYVKRQLEEAGLTVAVEGDFILCEDPGLFERSHDGVRGISRWLKETLSEYEEACAKLFEDSIDEEYTQEEPVNIVEKKIQDELLKIAPPVKEHAGPEAQMEQAREFNSPKEIAQALENDDQDRGGIPNSAYITEKKQEVAEAIVVLVKGQRFMAPDGWMIKEARTDVNLYYGSIYIERKMSNERRGSKFSLVRDQ